MKKIFLIIILFVFVHPVYSKTASLVLWDSEESLNRLARSTHKKDFSS